jgi:hypothetical protein
MSTYDVVVILAGAIGGFLRTYWFHDAKLVWPLITFRDKRFTMRLGFIASVLIGAVVAAFANIGMVSVAPNLVPDNIYTAALLGLFAGLSSLHILNKLLGMKLEDPDSMDICQPLAPLECNPHKIKIYEAIDTTGYCQRALIAEAQSSGVLKVLIVPKDNVDHKKAKKVIEAAIEKVKYPSIQVYVFLPEKVPINIKMVAEILDIDEPEEVLREYEENIEQVIRDYINSLHPGEPVLKGQIVYRSMKTYHLIRDTPGEKMSAEPPFKRGMIRIGKYEVAVAGKIDVKIIVRDIGGNNIY